MSTEEVTVADLAAEYNVDPSTAWRWLARLEEQHGSRVVKRRGPHLYTTRAALKRVQLPPPADPGATTTMPSPWAEMSEKAGSVSKLAEQFEVSTMTLYRWAHGRNKPSSRLVRRAVNAMARTYGTKAPWPEDD